jgi:hypothetical protein
MLRKFILAGAATALLTGAASAQMPMPSISLGEDKPPPTEEQLAKQKALDDAYKAATKKIPNKTVADDPWGSVRPNPSTAKTNKQQ